MGINVVGTKVLTNGARLENRICPSCHCGYWTNAAAPKNECADCDPPCGIEDNRGMGRNMDRKRSDSAYHGSNYNG